LRVPHLAIIFVNIRAINSLKQLIFEILSAKFKESMKNKIKPLDLSNYISGAAQAPVSTSRCKTGSCSLDLFRCSTGSFKSKYVLYISLKMPTSSGLHEAYQDKEADVLLTKLRDVRRQMDN
jgi:hypothetical protein